MYTIIRCILWLTASVAIALIVSKTKIARKKQLIVLAIVICLSLVTVSAMFPVENLLIDFATPEDVFAYTCFGEIEEIVYGESSCMIYYSAREGSYSHLFVLKSEGTYKIAGYFSNKNISHKFDNSGNFYVYHIVGSSDYYVIASIFDDKEIAIFDGNNVRVNSEIKRVKDTHFIGFYLKDFTNDYYLLINGEKVLISE